VNEGERREVLVRRLVRGTAEDGVDLGADDEARLTALTAESADFLVDIDEVLIPLEALESIEQTRRAYDRAAQVSPEAAVLLASFGRRSDLALATQELESELARCLGPVPRVARALDFGSGMGRFTPFLRRRSDWVLSVDLSIELLRVAGSGARILASSLDWARSTAQFGIILAADVLPALAHLPDRRRERLISHLFDRLEPCGVLLIVNHDYEMSAERSAEVIAHVCGCATVEWRAVQQTLWCGAVFSVRHS